MAGYIGNKAVNLSTSGADISGTANLDVIDVDGAANFAADVTFADGADIITASAGTSNFRAGVNAGNSITSGGDKNVLIGDETGTAITTGTRNTAIGFEALKTEDGHGRNVAVGYHALEDLNAGTNALNIGIGYNAGANLTTGIRNTLIGGNAADDLTDADDNVAIGRQALSSDTLGSKSVAIGNDTLFAQNFTTATDSYNTAVGYAAGGSVTTGTQNTLIGGLAGDGTDDGLRNTAVGYLALSANADNDNTAIGVEALSVTTAANSTAVGQKAGSALTSGSNCLFLGQNAGLTGHPGGNFTTQSNALVIGNVSTSAAHVQVDWTVASDQRDKTDFTALDLGLDFVKALAPVTYKWDKRAKYGDITADDYDLAAQTPDGTHKEDWLDIGFKAQEVQALEEAAGYTTASKKNLTVSTSDDGKQMGLQYSKFVPILVKAIQEQNALIEALTARVATLEG